MRDKGGAQRVYVPSFPATDAPDRSSPTTCGSSFVDKSSDMLVIDHPRCGKVPVVSGGGQIGVHEQRRDEVLMWPRIVEPPEHRQHDYVGLAARRQ